MFGYIKPLIPELKVKDKELYQAYYCGLCRALGRYGMTCRTALTYDATFAALLLTAAVPDSLPPEFRLKSCPLHPSRGKTPAALRTDVLDYCAAVCVLLAKYKLLDDAKDGKPMRRCLLPLYSHGAKKAAARYPEAAKILKEGMAKLDEAELAPEKDPDEAPVLFGEMLGDLICAYSHVSDGLRPVLKELCRAIGGYVYSVDAWDDRKDDRKRGCCNIFNSMLDKAEAEGEAEGMLSPAVRVRETASAMIDMYLNSASLAYDLLELKFCKPVLDNIIYLGLRNTADTVLARKEGDK